MTELEHLLLENLRNLENKTQSQLARQEKEIQSLKVKISEQQALLRDLGGLYRELEPLLERLNGALE